MSKPTIRVAPPAGRRMWPFALLVPLALAIGLLGASAYTVHETEQVILVQFGAPVGEPVTQAGLHFKLPFIQEVRRFDKRIKAWDGDPNQIPTRGREFISIDTTARWRIIDPLLFMRSVRDESGAQSRLNDIIDSVVRDQVSSTDLVEIVRSKDWAVETQLIEELAPDEQEQLTKRVAHGREELTNAIIHESRKVVSDFGIELVDVHIKRLNYIPSVREQVYRRMISERQRAAEEFRSEGQGASAEILGRARRELAEISSAAERNAAVIRGTGDAEATRIYNEAYSSDAEFYALYRTLESYGRTIGERSTLMMGTDSDYYRYLQGTGAKK